MKLTEIKEVLNCQSIHGTCDEDIQIKYAYASDLMSDVLVFPRPGALLITGLTNNQAVRTCKISASCAIIFVRNKKPNAGTIQLAKDYNIPILMTSLSMFETCGKLYSKGIKGVPRTNKND
jgi:hypothetical protein